ncbi:MAG: hypothetical protein LBP72_01345, partial [Dysgonamonadaceae bacterium]|nr:hypothetical protein [Dysgonamonadaceae bacterium]
MKRIYLLIVLFLFVSFQGFLFSQDKKEKISVSEEIVLPELSVVNNILYIKNAPVNSRLEIITIIGNKVLEIKIKSGNSAHELNLPKAIYIFKLEGVVR